jgi:hypothetical protein
LGDGEVGKSQQAVSGDQFVVMIDRLVQYLFGGKFKCFYSIDGNFLPGTVTEKKAKARPPWKLAGSHSWCI